MALAVIAVDADAAVLHYDSDFDQIAVAYPGLTSRWVVARGSID